jgi:hypothetical protein
MMFYTYKEVDGENLYMRNSSTSKVWKSTMQWVGVCNGVGYSDLHMSINVLYWSFDPCFTIDQIFFFINKKEYARFSNVFFFIVNEKKILKDEIKNKNILFKKWQKR